MKLSVSKRLAALLLAVMMLLSTLPFAFAEDMIGEQPPTGNEDEINLLSEGECAHVDGESVVVPATCGADGTKTVSCTVCSAVISSETIAATGAHTPGEAVEVPATCGADGSKTINCTVCNAVISSETISATGAHTSGEAVSSATCVADGTKTISCTICSAVISSEPAAATGVHTPGEAVSSATCVADGVKTVSCTVCGTEISSEPAAATGVHSPDEGQVTTPATCTEAGVKTFTCTVCSTSYTEEISATGHSHTEEITTPATCTAAGVKTFTCTCGDSFTQEIPAGHTYENGVCTVCGAVQCIWRPDCPAAEHEAGCIKGNVDKATVLFDALVNELALTDTITDEVEESVYLQMYGICELEANYRAAWAANPEYQMSVWNVIVDKLNLLVNELPAADSITGENFDAVKAQYDKLMLLQDTYRQIWYTSEREPDIYNLLMANENFSAVSEVISRGAPVTETAPAVAKIGETEYASIDEAIANWTNNTTLTLLADVTLTDVITLKSTEHHILDLGTYTMTAASGKDAIQYEVGGRSSMGAALTINADATNPGGITATGKTIVSHLKPSSGAPSKDRPQTIFNGGVFNASYVVKQGGTSSWGFLTSGYTGASAPGFIFNGGTFNGTIYTNRSLNLFYGGTFNGSLQMSVDSSAYTRIEGGTFRQLNNSMGSELNSDKFTIGSAKGAFDRGVYVDDNGYLVVGGASITEPGANFQASSTNYSAGGSYLEYSSAKTNGLYYTDVYKALEHNNKTSGVVSVYPENLNNNTLDLTGSNFKGTVEISKELTVTFAEGTEPSWKVASSVDGMKPVYTESVANGIVTRTYKLIDIDCVAQIGDVYYYSLDDAIDKADDGATIILLDNISLVESLHVVKNITIDPNGYSISSPDPNGGKIVIANDTAVLTISDIPGKTYGDNDIAHYKELAPGMCVSLGSIKITNKHDFAAATCESPATCIRPGCGQTKDEKLSHAGGTATCTKQAVCTNAGCGQPYGGLDPNKHSFTYTASGDTITETCTNGCDHKETAKLERDSAVSTVYTGSEIKALKVTYSSDKWKGGDLDITYSNNKEIGTAKGTITKTYDTDKTATAFAEFQISAITYTATPNNLRYVRGSGYPLSFTTNVPYTAANTLNSLTIFRANGTLVMNVPIDPNYVVLSSSPNGMTVITLSAAVMNSLEALNYELLAEFAYGAARTPFRVLLPFIFPMTGDEANALLMAAISLVAISGAAAIVITMKKKQPRYKGRH